MTDLHVLRFPDAAREWTEALPLGNGRLGAMCFGRLLDERIQINDDTAWSRWLHNLCPSKTVSPPSACSWSIAQTPTFG